MANDINWGKIYESTAWGSGVSDNSISWGKSYADLAGGGFTGLLDTYSGAAAAYSLRQLSSTYSGDAIVVRRASDNTTQSIGFVDNELDTATLESFCSGTDGFVTTWYDQSGNGVDAAQTTSSAQPKIVSSGSTILEGAKPTLSFDNSDDTLDTSFVIGSTTNLSAFTIVNIKDLSSLKYIWDARDGSTDGPAIFADPFVGNPAIRARFNATTLTKYPLVSNTQYLLSTLTNSTEFIFSTNGDTPLNGASSAINTTTSLRIGSASYISSGIMNGNFSELIIYKSDQTSNRSGIETNINDFYSIY